LWQRSMFNAKSPVLLTPAKTLSEGRALSTLFRRTFSKRECHDTKKISNRETKTGRRKQPCVVPIK